MGETTGAEFSVNKKTAIVTGAGSGISLEFAKLLLSKNCNVVFADLKLRPEASEIVEKYSSVSSSPRATFARTDVTSWSDLKSLFEHAVATFGTIDIVCPSAGVFEPPFSNFWYPPGSQESKDPLEGFGHYASIDINVTHPIRATQLAISEFLSPSNGGEKAGPGNPKRVVHLASIAAESAWLPMPLYCASKHAIAAFVRSLRDIEPTTGIRVNAVAPGPTRTPMWLENSEKLRLFNESEDDWVKPEEVAQAMLKLLESNEYPGGTLLEIGAENTRVIPEYGNMGPRGRGFHASNAVLAADDVFAGLRTGTWGKPQP